MGLAFGIRCCSLHLPQHNCRRIVGGFETQILFTGGIRSFNGANIRQHPPGTVLRERGLNERLVRVELVMIDSTLITIGAEKNLLGCAEIEIFGKLRCHFLRFKNAIAAWRIAQLAAL